MRRLRTWSVGLAVVFAHGIVANAQDPSWLAPFPPFQIAGNLHYVGSQGLASYLVTSPRGHILINSGLEASVPQIRRSIEALGFRFTDVKILLLSHAHWDHAAGSALVKKLTGATVMVMSGDAEVMATGGRTDFHYGDPTRADYPAVHVDRVLRDGDIVSLGDNVLVARLTPGHTKGCTTWTMRVPAQNATREVVIVGSPNVNPGYRLFDNRKYPNIRTDFERTFVVLRSLKADIFLGAHGGYFDLAAKYDRRRRGDRDAFVDPTGYVRFVADRERAFIREREAQR